MAFSVQSLPQRRDRTRGRTPPRLRVNRPPPADLCRRLPAGAEVRGPGEAAAVPPQLSPDAPGSSLGLPSAAPGGGPGDAGGLAPAAPDDSPAGGGVHGSSLGHPGGTMGTPSQGPDGLEWIVVQGSRVVHLVLPSSPSTPLCKSGPLRKPVLLRGAYPGSVGEVGTPHEACLGHARRRGLVRAQAGERPCSGWARRPRAGGN